MIGVVGVDGSPTCGVTTMPDLTAPLDAVLGCPLNRFDRSFINDTAAQWGADAVVGVGIDYETVGNNMLDPGEGPSTLVVIPVTAASSKWRPTNGHRLDGGFHATSVCF